MGSTYGKILNISIFGESHGPAVGVTIDNFPCGIEVDMDFIMQEMSRRAPSDAPSSTSRREKDIPQIVSGVKNGVTTGAPITILIENTNAKSGDYSPFATTPRPGHADFTANVRYSGHHDPNGGGHFSGRLTAPIVFAGALCKLALKRDNIKIGAHLLQVGDMFDDQFTQSILNESLLDELRTKNAPIINPLAETAIDKLVRDTAAKGDSIGGVVECAVLNAPAGLGSPIFDAVESRLSSFLFSIPAVRGVEFGAGFGVAFMSGSENNDEFYMDEGKIRTKTNNHGGALGGITTGMPILFRTAFKPTPSIFKTQNTVDLVQRCDATVTINGRHDPCIAFRAVPVCEAAAAIVLLDLYLEAYGYEKFR
ncbi:MAG: chorismate synthase [Clostridia bacterium]|nr:chorismate synthase [Clostridia bacterium]